MMSSGLLIERYLAELRQELWGGADGKMPILWEIEDHLKEGAARERAHGAEPEEAERRAIERFGLPKVIAQLFVAEIAVERGGNMWQRFTERARNAVFFAQGEAARVGERYVGSEHLLLGLVHQDNLAARILEFLGAPPNRIRCELEQRLTQGSGEIGEMQLTPSAKRVIDLAYDESKAMEHNYIGTEHLLLGMIREEEGPAARLLSELGVDVERARRGFQAVSPIWVQIERARQALESNEALYRALVAGPRIAAMASDPGRAADEAQGSETAKEEPPAGL
jgi:hypothetical protein